MQTHSFADRFKTSIEGTSRKYHRLNSDQLYSSATMLSHW
jgi:hypothetical protein